MANPLVCVVGAANADLIIKVDPSSQSEGYATGSSYSTQPGGKGLNTALSMAAIASDKVAFLSRVGNDILGRFLNEFISQSQLSNYSVQTDYRSHTGVGHVRIGSDGEYETVVFPGANDQISGEDVEGFLSQNQSVSWWVTNLESPLEWLHTAQQQTPNSRVAINVSPVNTRVEMALELADFIVLNLSEARDITSSGDGSTPEELIFALRGLTEAEIILTCGSDGAYALGREGSLLFEAARPVEVATTVGAGDAFFAAICLAVEGGLSLQQALSFGTEAGALVASSSNSFLSAESVGPLRNRLQNQIAGPSQKEPK